MSSEDNVQEDDLVWGDLEKNLLDRIINDKEDDGKKHLSNLFATTDVINDESLSKNTRKIVSLLKDVTSMMLIPTSLNEPYQPIMRFADGRRTALPIDFTPNDLDVLSRVFEEILYIPLLARIGDVLWICNRPKNPDHARRAIDCYIAGGIDSESWQLEGKNEFHRAYQLARLLKDQKRISTIESQLKTALLSKKEDLESIKLSIAHLIDELDILEDDCLEIASNLENYGEKKLAEDKPDSAVQFFELASKKYLQKTDEEKYILMLVKVAECYSLDAEIKFDSGKGGKLISSSLFETAIHAYRRIPTKHRDKYSVEGKIAALRIKLNEAGRCTLDEMGVIKTPFGENDEIIIRLSEEHVAGKVLKIEALIFFSGVCTTPNYKEMREREKESMSKYFLSSLFSSSQYSSDGRVIAKTPAVGIDSDEASYEAALKDKMIRSFNHEVDINVRLVILPALDKILEEHTVDTHFIFELCDRSPIVPKENINLIARAIWLGFEYDFSTAIHLVAPQIEKIVRGLIKDQGGHTTTIDSDGIEHENGLSTLLKMTEAKAALGDDVVFELKAVFSESVGPNLRNEVAHGLMTDEMAYSVTPVYAWWILVRMVVNSIHRYHLSNQDKSN